MSQTWHFYDAASGVFLGRSFSGPLGDVDANTPLGAHAWPAVAGDELDPLSTKVDLASGTLVSYQPPAPADTALVTYSWDAETLRWVGTPTEAAIGTGVRARRDALLTSCDWTQVADSPLDAATKAAWMAYRALLRAVPEQPGFPSSVTWPVAPA
jgi:hypothetical protein